jgi:triosephosphate isomerase
MLKKIGAKYIILGHSENRADGDTNKMILKKIESALKNNLKVIFCIGETLKEKLNGKTFLILKKQLKSSIKRNFNTKNIIIAYEPIWSIGTGRIPKNSDIEKNLKFIKKEFKKIIRKKYPPTVLYGGSVNSKNIRNFSSNSEIDGFLIGGASQSSKKFIDIIKNYYK